MLNKVAQFEDIVNEYQRDLVNFHYRFVGNRMEAEDLAQDTFIKAYKKFHTLQNPGKLKSWLFQIARNTVIDFFRRSKNREIALDNQIVENFAQTTTAEFQDKMANLEISKELERCIDQLIKEDRAIIRLLYYDGFSYKEISGLLGINQNTLKSRLHRARKVLLASIQTSPTLRDLAVELK